MNEFHNPGQFWAIFSIYFAIAAKKKQDSSGKKFKPLSPLEIHHTAAVSGD